MMGAYASAPMMTPDEQHYALVADAILDGEVIPFLGAGANLLVPADGELVDPDGARLPSGGELTAILAKKIYYPNPQATDLLRVAQYVDALLGEGKLYKVLHQIFDRSAPPNALHRLLAEIPARARRSGAPYQLIMTTNYDDCVERAFELAGEEYDLVWYEAKPRDRACGKFLHRGQDGKSVVIDRPNEYRGLSLRERTVILKLHGAVNRAEPENDSYVITENNYIDYLTHTDIAKAIPATLRAAMEGSHFLFLGYSMRDWNLRVILKRIWGRRPLAFQAWAVQKPLDDERENRVEQRLWAERRDEIELFQIELETYVAELADRLHAMDLSVQGSP
jgi:SIR2-like protein